MRANLARRPCGASRDASPTPSSRASWWIRRCLRAAQLDKEEPSISLFTLVTLLWSSGVAPSGDLGLLFWTRRRGTGAAGDQHAVDLSGYVALEAADDLSLALALLCAPRDVFLRAKIPAHPCQAGHVQRTVRLPVASSVETVPHHLAGGGLDGSDSAEAGEGGLAPQPLGVVAGHNQERRGVVGTDARQREQPRGGLRHQPLELRVQLGYLLRESLVAAGHRTERELGGRGHVAGVISEAEARGHRDELLRREPAQTVAHLLRCRHAQAL